MLLEGTDNIVLTEEFKEALTLLDGGNSLFLTGRAGTGKSTLVRHFLASTGRNVIVAAPTGIAALNVEGYTIHRLFSFSPRTTVEQVQSADYYPRRFSKTIKSLDTLVIDEASMIRADLFDCLAAALERFGPKPGTRFGGVQIVLVGDMYQLPPVVTEAESEYFSTRYSSPYFFAADSYDRAHFPLVELTTVFRQVGDPQLVDVLNSVREGALQDVERAVLNARTDASFLPPLDEFWLTLATTNRIAGARNRQMLEQLPLPALQHAASVTGDVDGFDKPTDDLLDYRVGAQIMLLSNDIDRRWANGTICRITGHRTDGGDVLVEVELPGGTFAEVGTHTWEINRPVVEAGRLRHEIVGTYTQLPFRLAWAITIHKSQGQTLERLVVDLAGGTFAYGQLYVALSRCTSMGGLVLRRDIEPKDLKVDQRIRRFLRSGGTEVASRGNVYLGVSTVGDEGRAWRPRPIEIALVTDDGLEVTTLVNPERDLGDARAAYGISASDVQLAPLLTEAWAALAPYLAGRTPFGVDIDQSLGYLDFELKRNGFVVPMPLGVEIDSTKLTPSQTERLRAPKALDRARAVRDIAGTGAAHNAFADVFPDPGQRTGYLLSRGQDAENFMVGGLVAAGDSADAVLAGHLRITAQRTSLNTQTRDFLRGVEARIGHPIIDSDDDLSGEADISAVLVTGARVCFTGTVIDEAGNTHSRQEMEAIAVSLGLEPVGSVTKAKCEALVTAEVGSQSGKAKNAAKFNKPTFDAELFLEWSKDPGAWYTSSVMSQEQAAPTLAAKEPAVHVVATSVPVAQSPVVEPGMAAPPAPVSIQNTPPTLRAIPADLQPEDRDSYLPEPYVGPKPDAVVSASQPEDPKPQPSSERMPQHAPPSYSAQVPPQPMPVPTKTHDPAPATLQPQPHDYSQEGPSSKPKKRQLKLQQIIAGIFGRPHDR
ncbi:AAA family ATPase [Arthrobacter sp. Sr24]